MTVFRRIRDLREDRDLTQKQVADALYMQLTQYRRYETGERMLPLDVAVEIAEFYGVTVDFLVDKKSDKDIRKFSEHEMTEKEKSLLRIFRALSEFNQGRLIERASFLQNEEKNRGNAE